MRTIFWIIFINIILISTQASAATFLYFNSQPGDFIGGGIEQTWSTEDGEFTASSSFSNVVTINLNGGALWNLSFAAPNAEVLKPGPYENAARFPFQSPTQPGLNVSGSGRGCNTLTGRFDILEISYKSNGEIDRFAADFEQHCEGGSSALLGSVRYNATAGFPFRLDIRANNKPTPIIVSVGENVKISLTTDAGDNEGVLAEHWLGMSGTYGMYWFNGEKWEQSLDQPIMAFSGPLATNIYTFEWSPQVPGVYMLQFVVDKEIDGKLNTQFVNHTVITVISN